MSSVPPVLAGCRILVTAQRRSDELSGALVRRGAEVVVAPTLGVVPHIDEETLLVRTRDILSGGVDTLVVTTAIGFRGWLDTAETAGLAEELLAVLDRVRLVARGPKARGALQAAGLRADWVAESETSAEIADFLVTEGVAGQRIAVQHHGAGDDGLDARLSGAGACRAAARGVPLGPAARRRRRRGLGAAAGRRLLRRGRVHLRARCRRVAARARPARRHRRGPLARRAGTGPRRGRRTGHRRAARRGGDAARRTGPGADGRPRPPRDHGPRRPVARRRDRRGSAAPAGVRRDPRPRRAAGVAVRPGGAPPAGRHPGPGGEPRRAAPGAARRLRRPAHRRGGGGAAARGGRLPGSGAHGDQARLRPHAGRRPGPHA